MRIVKFILAVLVFQTVSSQETKSLQITYNFSTNCNNHIIKSTIINNQQIDTLFIPPKKVRDELREINPYFSYKNPNKNVLIYNSTGILSGTLVIEEQLHLFDWKMSKGTKEILGYSCQKATTHFRGREFVAYFTTKLPFKAAPWKFHGLPGVVLQVYSVDKAINMTATALKTEKRSTEVMNPFKNTKAISWSDFVKKLDVEMEQLYGMAKSKTPTVSCSLDIEKFSFSKY